MIDTQRLEKLKAQANELSKNVQKLYHEFSIEKMKLIDLLVSIKELERQQNNKRS